MRISLKHSNSHWIEIKDDDGITSKFLIDYPSFEQQEKLEFLLYDCFGGIKMSGQKSEDRELSIAKYLKYKRYYLKYTIKDWSNVAFDDEGKEIKMILDGNEMNTGQWEELVMRADVVTKIFDAIDKELSFNDADKKKLNLSES